MDSSWSNAFAWPDKFSWRTGTTSMCGRLLIDSIGGLMYLRTTTNTTSFSIIQPCLIQKIRLKGCSTRGNDISQSCMNQKGPRWIDRYDRPAVARVLPRGTQLRSPGYRPVDSTASAGVGLGACRGRRSRTTPGTRRFVLGGEGAPVETAQAS
jgi:hypothetical protein